MDGAFTVDKPAAITSHDVVARVRRATRIRRVGHAGTLDPFATGLLVVCIGRATRLVQFLVGLDKEYEATLTLGYATDTQDLTGKQITPLRTSNAVSLEDIQQVLGEFAGDQLQTPPMYSAKKVAGERLYRAARAGREVERQPVPVTIHSLEMIGELMDVEGGTREFAVRVRCSSGTYVRTLAHDIGERLGVGAHLRALRRTAVGQFTIERAVSLDTIERMAAEGGIESALVTPSDLVAHLPLVQLDAERVEQVANGRELKRQGEGWLVDEAANFVRLCDESGALVAVGEMTSNADIVKPRVVMRQ